MSGKGTGSTSFEDMSHEQMLAWLDQANAGTVQAAATRLAAAAEEIRKIAEELKVRPQWVEWKGEGADAFRTWTGDLANATLRLGDFGEDSATWLGHASDAIAQAQVSIPRDKAGVRANLDAAAAAPNDPDAAAVTHKSTTELAALAADKEKVRQEAAAQMTKLGQAYRLSATQLDGLERPKFPPPPKAIQPAPGHLTDNEVVSTGDSRVRSSSGSGAAGVSSSEGSHRAMAEATAGHGAADGGHDSGGPARQLLPDASKSVGVHVDGAGVLQQTPSAPSASPVGPSSAGRVDAGGALPTAPVPPVASGVPLPAANVQGRGRTAVGGRPSGQPGRGQAGPVSRGVPGAGGTTGPEGPTGTARPVAGGRPVVAPGRGTTGAVPGRVPGGSNGIVGGRPMSPAAGSPVGRSANGLPRGNVVGGEGRASAGGRSPTAQRTPASTGRAGIGRSATPADRRGTGAEADRGVVGGRPQPQQRSGTRPFPPSGSGSARNQGFADGMRVSSTDGRPGGGRPSGTQPSNSRQKSKPGRRAGDRSDEQEAEQRNDGPTT
ncbi:translation initiation factor IF-2 [Streptomyces fagopyri]|uniref:translation initiation factor IF-2 n=1 Tax=Streptomyces fagopyri TaxID=2662397 RepID=UPI0037212AB6